MLFQLCEDREVGREIRFTFTDRFFKVALKNSLRESCVSICFERLRLRRLNALCKSSMSFSNENSTRCRDLLRFSDSIGLTQLKRHQVSSSSVNADAFDLKPSHWSLWRLLAFFLRKPSCCLWARLIDSEIVSQLVWVLLWKRMTESKKKKKQSYLKTQSEFAITLRIISKTFCYNCNGRRNWFY